MSMSQFFSGPLGKLSALVFSVVCATVSICGFIYSQVSGLRREIDDSRSKTIAELRVSVKETVSAEISRVETAQNAWVAGHERLTADRNREVDNRIASTEQELKEARIARENLMRMHNECMIGITEIKTLLGVNKGK